MLATPITGARSKSNLAGVEDVKGTSPARRHYARGSHHWSSKSSQASVEDVMGPSPARRHYARDPHHWDPEHQVLV